MAKTFNPLDYPVDCEAAEALHKLETSKPTTPGMYLHLYHGRLTREECMDDWGDDGPYFGPLQWFSVTYMSSITLCGLGSDDGLYMHGICTQVDGKTILRDPMLIIDDMIFYDGVYYGDWSLEYEP